MSRKIEKPIYNLKAKVWIYPGAGGWHFVSVPKKTSKEIKKLFGMMAGGWGSLPVVVAISKTSWKTSIFPDNKSGTYLLPFGVWVPYQINLAELIKARFKTRGANLMLSAL